MTDVTSAHIICGEPGALWITAVSVPSARKAILSNATAWSLPSMFLTPASSEEIPQKLPQQVMLNSLGAMFMAFEMVDGQASKKGANPHVEVFTAAMEHPRLLEALPWIDKYSLCVRRSTPVSRTIPMARVIAEYFVNMHRNYHMSVTKTHKKMFRLLSSQVMRGCTENSWSLWAAEPFLGRIRVEDATICRDAMPLERCWHADFLIDKRVQRRCIESFFLQFMIAMAAGDTEAPIHDREVFLDVWDLICRAMYRYKHRLEMNPNLFCNVISFITDKMNNTSWLEKVAKRPGIVQLLLHAAKHYAAQLPFLEGCTAFIASMILQGLEVADDWLNNKNLHAECLEMLEKVPMVPIDAKNRNKCVFASTVVAARARNLMGFTFGTDVASTIPFLLCFTALMRDIGRDMRLKGVTGDIYLIVDALASLKKEQEEEEEGAEAEVDGAPEPEEKKKKCRVVDIPGLSGCVADMLLAGMELDHDLLPSKDPCALFDITIHWKSTIGMAHGVFGDAILAHLANMIRKRSVLTDSKFLANFKSKMDKWNRECEEMDATQTEFAFDPITRCRIVEPFFAPGSSDALEASILMKCVWQRNRNPLTNTEMSLSQLIEFNELPEVKAKRKSMSSMGMLVI